MNIISALEQSCDVFFYEISLKTGIHKIKDMARRLGLGDVTGIDLPVKKGLIPSHEWKLANKGRYGPLVKRWCRQLVRGMC